MNDRQIEIIATAGLDAAISSILRRLGHDDGIVAEEYFSDEIEKQIVQIFSDYIKTEIATGK
jgi:hypothetical protein